LAKAASETTYSYVPPVRVYVLSSLRSIQCQRLGIRSTGHAYPNGQKANSTCDRTVGGTPFGAAPWLTARHESYFGFGVSHRSGIFGTSQLLGNVDVGSNYIYSYVEWKM
jgi:hypothetical protein